MGDKLRNKVGSKRFTKAWSANLKLGLLGLFGVYEKKKNLEVNQWL